MTAETALHWDGTALLALDQRRLPHAHTTLRLTSAGQIAEAIADLAIRGAPAIGVAAAFGVALSAREHGADTARVRTDAELLIRTRPTAIALRRAVHRTTSHLHEGADAVLAAAQEVQAADVRTCDAIGERGAHHILATLRRRPLRILTHCNTGMLATTGQGTALAVIKRLADHGAVENVLVGETRPLLQGARLTTWELRRAGIPHRLCVDAAGPALMANGEVDLVLVGADRITAAGDVANKIGTYALAVAAERHGIPFLVAAPEETIDQDLTEPGDVHVEERPADELTTLAGQPVAPRDTEVRNPAFDVTPADLVTAVITETRVWVPWPAAELCRIAADLYRRGWLDGTAGNLSVRADAHALITASGRSKGSLRPEDLVLVDAVTGTHRRGPKPSAETAIHAAVYAAFPDVGAVVHAHPPFATTIAARAAEAGDTQVRFTDFEIIKGLTAGAPATGVDVPLFRNWPHVPDIARDVTDRVTPDPPALLIAHHGVTTWGLTLETARNRLEALESLCRLQVMTTMRS
ncbi:S-methyl-5-thioribose-1-phosphate isomerase [Amycolatopsis sp. NPDC098790]|uniref:S-methyl-5-thioribose-1-phosphate isomerase n=1 Tax=Amycolatopsis sp. NPDC098790 TaxID=3363939 RepID=UPI003817C8E7